MYATEASPVSTSNADDLQFALTGALMNIFDTRLSSIVDTCGEVFGVRRVLSLIYARTEKFIVNLVSVDTPYGFVSLHSE